MERYKDLFHFFTFSLFHFFTLIGKWQHLWAFQSSEPCALGRVRPRPANSGIPKHIERCSRQRDSVLRQRAAARSSFGGRGISLFRLPLFLIRPNRSAGRCYLALRLLHRSRACNCGRAGSLTSPCTLAIGGRMRNRVRSSLRKIPA